MEAGNSHVQTLFASSVRTQDKDYSTDIKEEVLKRTDNKLKNADKFKLNIDSLNIQIKIEDHNQNSGITVIGMMLKPMSDLFKGTQLNDRLSQQSKLLESVNNKVIKGANDCATTTCNDDGQCPPIAEKWLSESDPPANYITLY